MLEHWTYPTTGGLIIISKLFFLSCHLSHTIHRKLYENWKNQFLHNFKNLFFLYIQGSYIKK